MDYDAITFDTQTVERNGFHFDVGLLAQLKQFAEGPIDVILSEIVVQELLKHLIEKTRLAKDGIEAASKKAAECGLIASASPNFVKDPVDIKGLAKERLHGFFNAIGATLIRIDAVKSRDVIDLYFGQKPPFSGQKKNEFPDAIALLSLEGWARDGGKKILAVSGDKDWAAFAEKSDHIDVVAELEVGLAKLQEHLDEANTIMQLILRGIASGETPDLADELFADVAQELSGLFVYGQADSSYYAEPEPVDLSLLELELNGIDDLDFTVVQAGRSKITARVKASLKVHAETSFSLSAYDSIDKEYIYMGSTHVEREKDIDAALLLTFEGEFASNDISLTDVEIVDAPSSIEFGYVEPDYGDDYDDPDDPLEEYAAQTGENSETEQPF